MATLPRCSICDRPVPPRSQNRSYPFCSDRCRLLDLSKWLGGQYRIPGPHLGDGDGEPYDSGAASQGLRPGQAAEGAGDPDDGGQ